MPAAAGDRRLFDDPPDLRRADRRLEPLAADLEDLDRLGDALEQVAAVRQPGQPLLVEGTHGAATRDVECTTGEQRLTAFGQRHEPSGRRLGQTLDLERLGAAGDVLWRVLVQQHLTEMNACPGLDPAAFLVRQPAQAAWYSRA